MKKRITLVAMILLLLLLSACGGKITEGKDSLTATKLTDREVQLLSLAGDKYFVFDFEAPLKYKKGEFTIVQYRFGKKTEASSTLYNEINKETLTKGMIFASLSENTEQSKIENDWRMMISADGSQSSSKFSLEVEPYVMSSWGTNPLQSIPITDKEIVLAEICYSSKSGGMSSLSQEFFLDPEKNLFEISSYDLVCLLKCKFY